MTNFEIAHRFTGLSAVELARKLDVSPQHLNAWLSGQRVPSRTNISGIAAAMGVSPAWLLGVPESLTLHDPVERADYIAPIMRAEHINGYGILYHVYLDETGDVVPVILTDGLQFTPADWSAAQAIRCAADIATESEDPAGVRWMDWRGIPAIMIDGFPRAFA